MALAGVANGDGEWIPLMPQLTRYLLHKHWTGNWRNRRGHWRGGLCYRWTRIIGIHGGDPLMTKVVGTGLHYRRLSLPVVRYQAIRWKIRICLSLDETSRRTRSRQKRGPGSFVPHFLDALWQLTQEVRHETD